MSKILCVSRTKSFSSLYFAAAWFGLAVYSLVFASLFLIYTSSTRINFNAGAFSYRTYQAQPNQTTGTPQEVTIAKGDARPLIVKAFFKEHNSPLADYADEFIKVADRYNLDYRLMPAIAMHESQGGKKMPKESFNPFGYGIYGGKVMKFDSFASAIERVGKGLRTDYLDQGLSTPYEIMTKYTPPSLEKGGAWAIGVSSFMDELQ